MLMIVIGGFHLPLSPTPPLPPLPLLLLLLLQPSTCGAQRMFSSS